MWFMWLAPGTTLPRNSAHGRGLARVHGRLGGVHVEMAGAGVLDVLRQHALEHAVQALDVGRVDVAGAAARLEQEQRVAVERDRVEVVRAAPRTPSSSRRRRRAPDPSAFFGFELLDVARSACASMNACSHGSLALALSAERLLARRRRRTASAPASIGPFRYEPQAQRFAPVADRAAGVALPGGAERAHGVELGERIHHLHALVEERLGFRIGGGDLLGEGAEAHGVDRNRFGDVLRQLGRGRTSRRVWRSSRPSACRAGPAAGATDVISTATPRREHGHSNASTTTTAHRIPPGP